MGIERREGQAVLASQRSDPDIVFWNGRSRMSEFCLDPAIFLSGLLAGGKNEYTFAKRGQGFALTLWL